MKRKTVKKILRWGIPLLVYGLILWVLPFALNPDNGWKIVIFIHVALGIEVAVCGVIGLYAWALKKEEWE